MHGNLWEWCGDIYDEAYGGIDVNTLALDPLGAKGGDSRVLRGGSWRNDGRRCRSARRFRRHPAGRLDVLGFRLFSGSK